MIKAVPFIQTIGTDKYQSILSQEFDIKMLCLLSDNDETKILFDGWRGKDMLNWFKITNEDGIILEFYPEHYIISKKGSNIKYQQKKPKTINNFIDDMNRYEIQIYWGDWIDEVAEPKDYMNKNKIKDYYNNLLKRIGKIN